MRHGLYAALRPPYPIQIHGNRRGDILTAARLANVLEPGSLNVPVTETGREIFASARGGERFRRALGDARACAAEAFERQQTKRDEREKDGDGGVQHGATFRRAADPEIAVLCVKMGWRLGPVSKIDS